MQQPSVSYKICSFLRDTLTQSHFATTPLDSCAALPHETFKCGLCRQCPYIKTSKNFVLPNGKHFKPRHFVNCSTFGVVYLIRSSCGGLHVGKTIRTRAKTTSKHVRDIKTGNLDRPLRRHAAFCHGYKDLHRWDVDKSLLNIETKWIYDLRAVDPSGLNDYISYKSFLKSWSRKALFA